MASQRAAPSVGKETQSDSKSYRRILLGYDGSENAKRALERAIALSAATGAAIRIVIAVNTVLVVYGPTAYYPPGYQEQVMKEGRTVLDWAIKRVADAGVKVSGSVEDGHPAETILDISEREGTDLVVLGRRGISGIERFVLGSVSSSVVNHSKCDVLIVK